MVEEVRTLKAQPGKDILIDGSSVLIHTLAAHDLIDEYSLHVYPVVLGGGKTLFPEGRRVDLRLIESRPLPSGVCTCATHAHEGPATRRHAAPCPMHSRARTGPRFDPPAPGDPAPGPFFLVR